MADLPCGVAAEVSALFDAKAAAWPAKYVPGGPLSGRLSQIGGAIRRSIGPGAAVLDLGCGTGELALRLSASGLRLTGCDISTAMLAMAVSSDYGRAVRWVSLTPEWRELPFQAGSFDAVVAASVLEYVQDPALVLSECARVLKPGGTLHCTVPDLRHPTRWMELPAWWAVRLLPRRRAGRLGANRAAHYLSYLRLSRHRHRAAWWHAAAQRAGLDITADDRPDRDEPEPRRPLRLLSLRRHAADGAG
jgi:SAM-dependent methyltransferase